jgi:twitching motility protein PilT
VSQLTPLLTTVKESGAERVVFAPDEPGIVVDGEEKRFLPGGPIRAAVILEAVSELLSHDDIMGLSGRPRIVRHEHEGENFVLEIVRQPNGIALGIRQAAKPGRVALKETVRREDVSPAMPVEAHRPAALSPGPASAAKPGARASRRMRGPAPEPTSVDGAVDQAVRATDAAPAQDVRELARAAARETAEAIAREVAQAVARDAAQEVARKVANEAARKFAQEASTLTGAAHGATADGRSAQSTSARGGPAKIDSLLREMLQKRASDLHLSAGSPPVLRVDGEIHFGTERGVFASADILSMVQEIMPERARHDFESLHDADFAYELAGAARFRVNVFQDRQGTGAVLRQIPIEILSAEKLGLPKACLDLCWLTKGLVVVTGPTGSGKSTTLAAMIDFINKNRSDHIITIEDPVEFVHKNQKCLVNQREIGQHTKSFKNALRAALREDPDIVLVGEMRDLETISIAIETAETGHLVFGTLHTTTAISTVDRIIDQFPSDRQEQIRVMLSESLKGVVAQVLCPKIGGGRVAAHEILLGSHAVASMIREGKTFQLPSVMQTSKGQGMVTMNDSLLALVQKKIVDPKQAYMKAIDKTAFVGMLRSAGIQPPV